jgi:hypothetical protein
MLLKMKVSRFQTVSVSKNFSQKSAILGLNGNLVIAGMLEVFLTCISISIGVCMPSFLLFLH